MHGLINRAIQCFIRDTYGADAWQAVAHAANVPAAGFEAMFVYEDATTDRVLAASSDVLCRPLEIICEDLGTYLVSHSDLEPLRRLLRFGGETFVDFLHSIDDLPRRAALALPDLVLPSLEVLDAGDGFVRIGCLWERPGFGHVLVGMLRTLADDYGALVVLDHDGRQGIQEWISVRILSTDHAAGRPFQLAAGA